MKKLQIMVKLWLRKRRRNKVEQREEAEWRKANEKINIIEYCGVIYFAYDSVPLIPIDNINREITKLLPEIRATYLTWKENTKQL